MSNLFLSGSFLAIYLSKKQTGFINYRQAFDEKRRILIPTDLCLKHRKHDKKNMLTLKKSASAYHRGGIKKLANIH